MTGLNIPFEQFVDCEALAELQALIRCALFDQEDASARSLDDILATKSKSIQLTAIAIAMRLKPYEVKS